MYGKDLYVRVLLLNKLYELSDYPEILDAQRWIQPEDGSNRYVSMCVK